MPVLCTCKVMVVNHINFFIFFNDKWSVKFFMSYMCSSSHRLAHKSSFWARSATVSAKRDRTSAEREARASESSLFVPGPTTPDQKTKRTTLRKSTVHSDTHAGMTY